MPASERARTRITLNPQNATQLYNHKYAIVHLMLSYFTAENPRQIWIWRADVSFWTLSSHRHRRGISVSETCTLNRGIWELLYPSSRAHKSQPLNTALLSEFNILLCCSIPHHTLTLVCKGLWQVQEPNINDKNRVNGIIMKLYFSEEPCGQFLTFSNGNDSKYLIYLTGRKNSMNLVFYGL